MIMPAWVVNHLALSSQYKRINELIKRLNTNCQTYLIKDVHIRKYQVL